MEKAMRTDRASLLACLKDEVPEASLREFIPFVYKRGQGFPLQYLTGRQDFMSLPFLVEEGVLIPRGDTEVLVETLLDLDIAFDNILDVGTGSGIIAVSLARYLPQCQVTALDISSRALELAAKNARIFDVADRILFVQADIFKWTPSGKYSLIVSNPPYIPRSEIKALQREVGFEPPEALDGGEKGLDFYYRLAELAPGFLKPEGVLAVETGWRHGEAVGEIFGKKCALNDITVVPDYEGRDRVVLARKGKE